MQHTLHFPIHCTNPLSKDQTTTRLTVDCRSALDSGKGLDVSPLNLLKFLPIGRVR